jgi:hypothetical protein
VNHSPEIIYKHVLDYAGSERPLVLLDNNAASRGFFPVQWRSGKAGINELVDASYPDIRTYLPDSSRAYAYLLTFDEGKVTDQQEYLRFRAVLRDRFTLVAGSPSGRVKLYMPNR